MPEMMRKQNPERPQHSRNRTRIDPTQRIEGVEARE